MVSRKELLMSIEGNTLAEAGTPAYVTRFDGVRVPATVVRSARTYAKAASAASTAAARAPPVLR
jgi:hypothetical protein